MDTCSSNRLHLEIGNPTTDLLTPQDDDAITRWSGKHFGGHERITKLVTRGGYTGTLYTLGSDTERHVHMAEKDPPNLTVSG